jgi:ABC-type phosphate transport system auxiliary subunit
LLGSGIALLFKLLMASHARTVADLEKRLGDVEALKRTYQEMAGEAIRSAKQTADFYRLKHENKPPIVLDEPVVPESSSPPSRLQKETATLATMRANMARIKREMGQAPRTGSNE